MASPVADDSGRYNSNDYSSKEAAPHVRDQARVIRRMAIAALLMAHQSLGPLYSIPEEDETSG